MKKTMLCIVDGLGVNNNDYGNAAKAADMKNLNAAIDSFPSAQIKASGLEVGLADAADPGNSEVGHNAIGCGQYIKQGLALLNAKYQSGEIYKSDAWAKLAANAKKTKLNIIILLSDGRLHSDLPHLFSILKQCVKENIKVAIHACLDGRDVPTQSANHYINMTREFIKNCGANAKIATVAGRSILWMDRYESMTHLLTNAVEVCVLGNGIIVNNVEDAINAEYAKKPDMTDETMPAFILEKDWLINNGDSVLLANYRGDRAVEICEMFEQGKYLYKENYNAIKDCVFMGALQYDTEKNLPKEFLCSPPVINNTLTHWLVESGVRQYTVTETVKFGHMTYFFNGNRAKPISDVYEKWTEFKSDVCNNMFNTAPKMQAQKITNDAIDALKSGKYDFVKLNLPNPDMVGHTADFAATVEACKEVDECLGEIIKACKSEKANLIITADHGNAEFMLYDNGKPRSSHTNALVPFVVLPFAEEKEVKIKQGEFGLTNVASTVCNLLGLKENPVWNQGIIKT